MKMHIYGDGIKKALLLHGMASSSNAWTLLIKDLVNEGYRVYAPDLPGHGVGVKDPALYCLDKWTELILAELDQVELLVGHSLGGLLAIKLRSSLRPNKTVLIDPVLRFPSGILSSLARMIFFSNLQLSRLSRDVFEKANILSWDRLSVKMIKAPTRLQALDTSVLVIRPKASFVAPLSSFKGLRGVTIVTLAKAHHNLHLGSYPQMLAALDSFVFKDFPKKSSDEFALAQKAVLG